MSSKQLKTIIIIVVAAIIIVASVFAFIFFFDGDVSSSGDIEAIKAAGNYEMASIDVINNFGLRETQGVTFADALFEKIGIKKYEGCSRSGARGNYTVFADGFEIDCYISGGALGVAYIGDVIIYRDNRVSANVSNTASEYTYSQYQTVVSAFRRALKLDETTAKKIYRKLTDEGLNSFSNAKKGKLNGVNGYYGYEGELKYFLTLNENHEIKTISVVCDGFEPMCFYSIIGVADYNLSDIKVISGARMGIANVMAYRIKQVSDITVTLPSALLSGDDSWLIVRNGDDLYIEVMGEVAGSGGKIKTKKFVIKCDYKDRNIYYMKVDRKVIVDF